MRFILALLFVLVFCISCKDSPTVPTSSAVQESSLQSEALDREMKYSVYLPKGFQESGDKEYPVLYLLHGYFGTYRDWPDNGMQQIVDEVIEEGESDEIIIIMPDGLDSFYINDFDDRSLKYEEFYVNEFIPHIEQTYPVSTTREMTGIAGLSMGGYGATYHAFKYTGKYAFSYSLSGAVGIGGSTHDIRSIIIERSTDEAISWPEYFMDCGTHDYLLSNNEAFSVFLEEQNITHTFTTRLGAHDWVFWTTGLPDVIKKFYEVRTNI